MYPKVKVRDYDDQNDHVHHHGHGHGHGHGHDVGRKKYGERSCNLDGHDHRRYHVASLKDVQSLFEEVSCASSHHSAKHDQDFSTPRIARVVVPKVLVSGTSRKQREMDHRSQQNKKDYHDVRQNEDISHDIQQYKDNDEGRANSILRPRAVISSPANDTMIGRRNMTKARQPLPLKRHDSVKNRHVKAQCRVYIGHVIDESPDNTRQNENCSNREGDSISKATGSMPKVKPRNEKASTRDLCCS